MAIEPKKVLFICLGNICRSPIAEAVFCHVLKERSLEGWEVDSAAIGPWHVGKKPDPRARSVMKKHNIERDQYARQVVKKDFTKYDYIFGMDDENMDDLKDMKPTNSTAVLEKFCQYDPEKSTTIRDPYYDSAKDESGFETCYVQTLRCSNGFLDSL